MDSSQWGQSKAVIMCGSWKSWVHDQRAHNALVHGQIIHNALHHVFHVLVYAVAQTALLHQPHHLYVARVSANGE